VGPGPREKKINSFILKLSCKINLDIKNITARKKAKKKKKKKKGILQAIVKNKHVNLYGPKMASKTRCRLDA
jgi:hypothetical protein